MALLPLLPATTRAWEVALPSVRQWKGWLRMGELDYGSFSLPGLREEAAVALKTKPVLLIVLTPLPRIEPQQVL